MALLNPAAPSNQAYELQTEILKFNHRDLSPTPRLTELCISEFRKNFKGKTFGERVAIIQKQMIPQELKACLLLADTENALKNAKTSKARLAIFKRIKTLCSVSFQGEKADLYNPHLFYYYFTPILKRTSSDQKQPIMITKKIKDLSEDTALSEIIGCSSTFNIPNRDDLSYALNPKHQIMRMIVTYQFRNNEVVSLAKALIDNIRLIRLNLTDVQIGAEGATRLAEALKSNRTLEHLNLQKNNIGYNGTSALAEALEKNKTLTSLDLGINNIGPEGATLLVEALRKNKGLTSLNLYANPIGNEATATFQNLHNLKPNVKIIF